MDLLQKLRGEKGSQIVRRGIQFLFLVIVCFVGYRFVEFVSPLENGMLPLVDRPPAVEMFLPISALVSLKYFAFTGIINEVHPSGFILFIIICLFPKRIGMNGEDKSNKSLKTISIFQ